jgi:hypothetical protein
MLFVAAACCDALKTKIYDVPATLLRIDVATSHNKAYLE